MNQNIRINSASQPRANRVELRLGDMRLAHTSRVEARRISYDTTHMGYVRPSYVAAAQSFDHSFLNHDRTASAKANGTDRPT